MGVGRGGFNVGQAYGSQHVHIEMKSKVLPDTACTVVVRPTYRFGEVLKGTAFKS